MWADITELVMDSLWVIVFLAARLRGSLVQQLQYPLTIYLNCLCNIKGVQAPICSFAGGACLAADVKVVDALLSPYILLSECAELLLRLDSPCSLPLRCCHCIGMWFQSSDARCQGAEGQCVGLLLCCMKEDMDHYATSCRYSALYMITKDCILVRIL